MTSAARTAAGITKAFTETAATVAQNVLTAVAGIPALMFPTVDPGYVQDILGEYADAYKRESAARVKEGVAAAVRLPTREEAVKRAASALEAALSADPPDRMAVRKTQAALRRARAGEGTRELAITRVMDNEKRYAAQHARAQVARSKPVRRPLASGSGVEQ